MKEPNEQSDPLQKGDAEPQERDGDHTEPPCGAEEDVTDPEAEEKQKEVHAFLEQKENERLKKAEEKRKKNFYAAAMAIADLLPLALLPETGLFQTVCFFLLLLASFAFTLRIGWKKGGKLLRMFSCLGVVYFPLLLYSRILPSVGQILSAVIAVIAAVLCLLSAVIQSDRGRKDGEDNKDGEDKKDF